MAKSAVNYTGLIPETGDSFESATQNTTGSLEGIDTKLGELGSGKADLISGKIPIDQIPLSMNDFQEGYYKTVDGLMYQDSAFTVLLDKLTDVLYLDLNTKNQYRYTGTIYEYVGTGAEATQTTNGLMSAFDKKKLDKKVYTFDIIADAQASTWLVEGDIIEVLGYYSKNDGAGHKRVYSLTDDGSGVVCGDGFLNIIPLNNFTTPKMFGCICDGTTDDSILFDKAIKHKSITILDYDSNLFINREVVSNVVGKLILGSKNSKISVGENGFISLSSEKNVVEHIYFTATTSNKKVLYVKSANTTIRNNNFFCLGDKIIKLADEVGVDNIYSFSCTISGNWFWGNPSKTVGIETGLYSHDLNIFRNSISKCKTTISLTRESSLINIIGNVIQPDGSNSDSVGVLLEFAGVSYSDNIFNLNIKDNYFEENQICILHKNINCPSMEISGNYCSRNTGNKIESYFYKNDVVNSTQNAKINNNYISGYETAFYTDFNFLQGVKVFSNDYPEVDYITRGIFGKNFYEILTINPAIDSFLSQGTFLNKGFNRIELSTNAVLNVPFFVDKKFVENIKFKFIPIGSPSGCTVKLYKIDYSSYDTLTELENTFIVSTDGIQILELNKFLHGSYFLEFSTTTDYPYIYPITINCI